MQQNDTIAENFIIDFSFLDMSKKGKYYKKFSRNSNFLMNQNRNSIKY